MWRNGLQYQPPSFTDIVLSKWKMEDGTHGNLNSRNNGTKSLSFSRVEHIVDIWPACIVSSRLVLPGLILYLFAFLLSRRLAFARLVVSCRVLHCRVSSYCYRIVSSCIVFRLVSSCLVSSRFIFLPLPCLVSFCRLASVCLVLYHLISSCLILSRLVLSRLVSSCPLLSCLVPSHLVFLPLSRLVLSFSPCLVSSSGSL